MTAHAATQPFRHWVLDGFYSPGRAEKIARAFEMIGESAWYPRAHRHSLKWVTRNATDLPEALFAALSDLNHRAFLSKLEHLTGITPILPDPTFYGGGCHQSRPGSFLDLHADFTEHESLNARRCLNLLIYLSPEWRPEWGGHLELWDEPVWKCVRRIAPLHNRAVLFETGATSWHGHPDPMRGPATARRNSLALYYYTPWKDGEARLPTTVYRARPHEVGERMRLWAGRTLRRWGWRH